MEIDKQLRLAVSTCKPKSASSLAQSTSSGQQQVRTVVSRQLQLLKSLSTLGRSSGPPAQTGAAPPTREPQSGPRAGGEGRDVVANVPADDGAPNPPALPLKTSASGGGHLRVFLRAPVLFYGKIY